MNLILDPTTMNPHLKYLIPNSLYFTIEGQHFQNMWSGGENKYEINNKYNVNYDDEISKINDICNSGKKFENMFFSLSILSSEETHQGNSNILWIKLYLELYNKFKDFISNKIIIIDNHGGDYEPSIYLSKFNFKYDIILKRVYSYRNKNKYNEITHSYPFIMDTNNDPMYKLYNKPKYIVNLEQKINKIYWAGSLFKYDEEWDDGNTFEHGDRINIISNIQNINSNVVEQKYTTYETFHNTISSYKYALDIRGTSRLNKRLYEILSTNTLLLAEKIDIVWPFEDGDSFSEECFFSSAEELIEKYIMFENDEKLYKKCLDNQLYIVDKYFNNEWLWKYINKLL